MRLHILLFILGLASIQLFDARSIEISEEIAQTSEIVADDEIAQTNEIVTEDEIAKENEDKVSVLRANIDVKYIENKEEKADKAIEEKQVDETEVVDKVDDKEVEEMRVIFKEKNKAVKGLYLIDSEDDKEKVDAAYISNYPQKFQKVKSFGFVNPFADDTESPTKYKVNEDYRPDAWTKPIYSDKKVYNYLSKSPSFTPHELALIDEVRRQVIEELKVANSNYGTYSAFDIKRPQSLQYPAKPFNQLLVDNTHQKYIPRQIESINSKYQPQYVPSYQSKYENPRQYLPSKPLYEAQYNPVGQQYMPSYQAVPQFYPPFPNPYPYY